MLPKLLQKRKKEGTLPNPLYEGLAVMSDMDINKFTDQYVKIYVKSS